MGYFVGSSFFSFPFCQKPPSKSLFWVDMVQFAHPRRSPLGTNQHSPFIFPAIWFSINGPDPLEEPSPPRKTNTSVHFAHRPQNLPCASFIRLSANLKTLVIGRGLSLLNNNNPTATSTVTLEKPPLGRGNRVSSQETCSPTQLDPIQSDSTQPNPAFSLPPTTAPASIPHHPGQVASCPAPSSPDSYGQEEGFSIEKNQVSLRLLPGRLGGWVGGLDKETRGCISSPCAWPQRQSAAGLCPPTPGKEVKPQESSKQVEV